MIIEFITNPFRPARIDLSDDYGRMIRSDGGEMSVSLSALRDDSVISVRTKPKIQCGLMNLYNLFLFTFIFIASTSCINPDKPTNSISMSKQQNLKNEEIKSYTFLECMYEDDYFPAFLVDKCKQILVDLCEAIERDNPKDLDQLYALTHAATEKLNDLEDEFMDNDSELETGAAECFAENFQFIAEAYGFEADVEELIATRNW
jgi:hypothetical protein